MKPVRILPVLLVSLCTIHAATAQVPGIINYQGRVAVGGTNFDGTGQFKLSLVNDSGSTTYWSNGNTAVSLTVTKGLYSVLLGDTTIPNMTTAIPATVFSNSDVRLRVSFNDGVSGFQQLTPDQRLGAVGYAMLAASVDPNSEVKGYRLKIGIGHSVAGALTTIAGGGNNDVNGDLATVGGGNGNHASAYATVGGGVNNYAGAGAVIGGGGHDGTFFLGNSALGGASTVGGGFGNSAAATYATVGGGFGNDASANSTTIGGGYDNSATADSATVPGGAFNSASGTGSFAAGRRAKANHHGAFVWGDNTDADVSSTGTNQFVVRARGGVRLDDPGTSLYFGSTTRQALNVYGTDYAIGSQYDTLYFRCANFDANSGFIWYKGGVHNDNYVGSGGAGGGTEMMHLVAAGLYVNGVLVPSSDRNAKANFTPVDSREVLAKVAALPISSWNFKQDAGTRHIGPMAQDFYTAFATGSDDKHIATVDADGVALAAIQGLYQELQEQKAQNAELRHRLDELERRTGK